MINIPQSMKLPLQLNEHGKILVSGTRVTLDTLLEWYSHGQTPEDLHEGFETIPLSDIYVIISYYLANRDEVEAYLQKHQEESARLRAEIEDNYTEEQKAHSEKLRRIKSLS